MGKMDAGPELAAGFRFILNNLQTIIAKQEELLEAFASRQASEASEGPEDAGGDIELF